MNSLGWRKGACEVGGQLECEARKIIQGESARCKLDTLKILTLNTHLKIRTKRWHVFTVEFYEPQRETKLYHQKGSGWSWSSSYKQSKTEACFSLICTVHFKKYVSEGW